MMPHKKTNEKTEMHSSCFVGSPEVKVIGKGFMTFHSLRNRKNDGHDAYDYSPAIGKKCKKEFEMIETISKRLWLNDNPAL